MTFYDRSGMLYARINGKRVSTKLEYSKENIKLFPLDSINLRQGEIDISLIENNNSVNIF